MRQELSDLLKISVSALIEEGVISVDVPADVYIERTRQRDHGDFACNIAMILAKSARMKLPFAAKHIDRQDRGGWTGFHQYLSDP